MAMNNRQITLIAHNLRSCHNVGSLLRTAEGLGATVWLTGYTPYPKQQIDTRLPHEALKIDKQIHKTALGAEALVDWKFSPDVLTVITNLKARDNMIVAIEQYPSKSVALDSLILGKKVTLIVGREVEGIEPDILDACDQIAEIPMFGKKESFNVTQAAAMAIYRCRFGN